MLTSREIELIEKDMEGEFRANLKEPALRASAEHFRKFMEEQEICKSYGGIFATMVNKAFPVEINITSSIMAMRVFTQLMRTNRDIAEYVQKTVQLNAEPEEQHYTAVFFRRSMVETLTELGLKAE